MTQWLTTTEYLFGYKKEYYYGMKFPFVAHVRIQDAKRVKYKLYNRVSYYPQDQNKFQRWLRIRIRKVDDAIRTWEKILEVEE